MSNYILGVLAIILYLTASTMAYNEEVNTTNINYEIAL